MHGQGCISRDSDFSVHPRHIDKEKREAEILRVRDEITNKPGPLLVVIAHVEDGDTYSTMQLRLGTPIAEFETPIEKVQTIASTDAVRVRLSYQSEVEHPGAEKCSELFKEFGWHDGTFDDLNEKVVPHNFFPKNLKLQLRLEFIFGKEAIDAWFLERGLFEAQIILYKAFGFALPASLERDDSIERQAMEQYWKMLQAGLKGRDLQKEASRILGNSHHPCLGLFAAELISGARRQEASERQAEIQRAMSRLELLGFSKAEVWNGFGSFMSSLLQEFSTLDLNKS